MPSLFKKLSWPTFLILILLFSAGLTAYAWLLFQIESGNRALQKGDASTAALIFSSAEEPFFKVPLLARIFKDDYQKLVFNRVGILYVEGKDDEVIKKLEDDAIRAPFLSESGEYAFWMGNSLVRRAIQSKNPESVVNGLKAALAEYQRGLVAYPEDWDLKYNYELVKHILSLRGMVKAYGEEEEEENFKSLLDKMQPPKVQSPGQLLPEKQG